MLIQEGLDASYSAKIPVLPGLNSLPEYTSGTTSKHALS